MDRKALERAVLEKRVREKRALAASSTPVASAEPEVSKLESAGRGAAQGASLGFADEIVGGAKALWDVATTDAELLDMRASYPEYRDEYRQADKAAQQANPITYGGGNVAGGAATMLIPGLNVAKGATALNAGIAGARAAGIAGVGASEREGLESLRDLPEAAGVGFVVGGVTQGATNALFGKHVRAADALENFSDDRTVKALDPVLNQQSRLDNKGITRDLGRELRKSGVVRFGSNVKDMAPRLDDLLTEKGRRIGEIRQLADDAGGQVDIAGLSRKGDMMTALTEHGVQGSKDIARNYSDEIASLSGKPVRSITEIQDQIATINDLIPFEKDPGKLTAAQKALTELRRDLATKMDEGIESVRPDLSKEHSALKDQFHLFKEGEKVLDKSVARQSRNRDFSITDYFAANTVKPSGDNGFGLTNIAIGIANKQLRERGNSMLAVGADKIAEVARRDPSRFGKYASTISQAAARGGTSLSVTHFLLQQRDPEYRETVQRAMNNEEAP